MKLKWSVPFDVPFPMFRVEMVEASNSIFGQNHKKKRDNGGLEMVEASRVT